MTAASTHNRNTSLRSGWWTFLRLLLGWALVAGLAYYLWTPGDWPTKLLAWVLLALLADECAGWFGYMALALGVLPLISPHAPPEQWFIVLPLIGGALFALLIVKHSGGPFVLPFGAALFVGVILAAAKFGIKIDPSLTLPAHSTFQQMAILPMLGVVLFSFVRQLISMILRWQARRSSGRSTVPKPVQPLSDAQPLPNVPPATDLNLVPETPQNKSVIIDMDLTQPPEKADKTK